MYRILNARFAVLFCVLFTLATPLLANEGTDVIGTVSRIQKSAVAMQDALPRILKAGSDIQLGDVISTGKGARVEIIMSDGAKLTLGERTHFVVQEYVISQGGNNAVMRLLEGAFKVTSGKLMQSADASFVVNTNTATIGIRGTTFWGGSLDGDFEVSLLAGKGVYVETKAGRVNLSSIDEGTKITSANLSPSKPKKWGQKKVDRAAATVTFNE